MLMEKTEAYLAQFLVRDSRDYGEFTLTDTGMYFHRSFTFSDSEGDSYVIGFSIRLNASQLEDVKRLVAEDMGAAPSPEEFSRVLSFTAHSLSQRKAIRVKNAGIVYGLIAILVIGCIGMANALNSFSVPMLGMAVTFLVCSIRFISPGKSRVAAVLASLLLMSVSVLWVVGDVNPDAVAPVKRFMQRAFGTPEQQVEALYDNLIDWEHDDAVAVFASMEPEKAAELLEDRLLVTDSRLSLARWREEQAKKPKSYGPTKAPTAADMRMEYYVPSYDLCKTMPVVLELAETGFLTPEQDERLTAIFLRRYPVSDYAFNDEEDVALFQQVLDHCSDAFLADFYPRVSDLEDLPVSLQASLKARLYPATATPLPGPTPTPHVSALQDGFSLLGYWVLHSGEEVAPAILRFHKGGSGNIYTFIKGHEQHWQQYGELRLKDMLCGQTFTWLLEEADGQSLITINPSDPVQYGITAHDDLDGSGRRGFTLTLDGASGSWIHAGE